ncbi:MAG: DUF6064 family protein [Ramlibacter sp.]
MSEWWTYRPSDFLMFSARSWGRLLEAMNRDAWPAQPLLVLAGLLLVALAARMPRNVQRGALALLAIAWAWVAWNFHWHRFATLDTAAPWFAAAWLLEAALLPVLGWLPAMDAPRRALRTAGIALAALAVIAYPAAAPLTGRGWAQAEVVGLAPDPTALLTVGALLALPLRHRSWLLVLPIAWLAVGWMQDWLLFAR